jgi:hypothetical protein
VKPKKERAASRATLNENQLSDLYRGLNPSSTWRETHRRRRSNERLARLLSVFGVWRAALERMAAR